MHSIASVGEKRIVFLSHKQLAHHHERIYDRQDHSAVHLSFACHSIWGTRASRIVNDHHCNGFRYASRSHMFAICKLSNGGSSTNPLSDSEILLFAHLSSPTLWTTLLSEKLGNTDLSRDPKRMARLIVSLFCSRSSNARTQPHRYQNLFSSIPHLLPVNIISSVPCPTRPCLLRHPCVLPLVATPMP